tara:strand:- start:1016 stop:2341 length:1326 start_codon:yes stop_codon:yes gene_type:complete
MKKINTLKSYKSKSLIGIINLPGDKSISQRAVIFASLCLGLTKVFGLLKSKDVFSTINALKALGIKIKFNSEICEISGTGGVFKKPKKTLDLGNSGTGVRLLIGMLSSKNIEVTFKGDKSLSKRPMLRVIKPLEKFGVKFESNNGKLPIKILKTSFLSPCTVNEKIGSAQVKSALILSALNLHGTSIINEIIPSRDHTENLLKHLGADLEIKKKKIGKKIIVKGPQILKKKKIKICGDFSSASFLIVAAMICKNSKIILKNVGINYFRIGLLEVLKKMNGKFKILKKWTENGENVADIEIKSSNLVGLKVSGNISARLIDEYPILFVAASFARGPTEFNNLKELRYKESDRLTAMAEALEKSGVKLKQKEDSIKIFGSDVQNGGVKIKTHYDHRIAMSMLIFGLASEKPISVDDISMIETSFPNFAKLLKKIGAKIKYVQK